MEINSPTWHLKQSCPVCNQGSSLVLVKCPACGYVITECSEEGTQFDNFKIFDKDHIISTGFDCPGCKQAKTTDFIILSGEEYKNIGLTIDEYE